MRVWLRNSQFGSVYLSTYSFTWPSWKVVLRGKDSAGSSERESSVASKPSLLGKGEDSIGQGFIYSFPK